MSNTANDWIPVVGNTFSLRGLQPCFASDSGADNWGKATPPLGEVKSPPSYNTNGGITKEHPLSSEPFISKNFKGIIKLYTTARNMFSSLNSSSKRRRKTLEALALNCCIERLDIKLTGNGSCIRCLTVAVTNINKTGVLIDWLLLKCEATQMDFNNLDEEVAIYSTNSYNYLRKAVYKNSCLPLPLIHKLENESYQYFYLAFNRGENPKITKLNNFLFKKQKKTNLKRGIKLMNSYTIKTEEYKFYGERGFHFFLMENETSIKKIIFRHIVWGYLQAWVRKVVKLHRFTLTVEKVAKDLLICRAAPKDVEELKDAALRSRRLYLLGFCHNFFLYLKFFNVNSNQRSEYSISITNVETKFVSEIPIVQYFRQYLYLNKPSEASFMEAIAGMTHEDADCPLHFPHVTHSQDRLHPAFPPKNVIACPHEQCNIIPKLLRSGEITARKVKYQLFPLIRDSLDSCYLANMVETSQRDISSDEAFIRNCFRTAVASADKTKTFYVFLDQVFRYLQLYFTNSTCRRIMDLMVYEKLRNKYSDVLNQVEETSGPGGEPQQPEIKKRAGLDEGGRKQGAETQQTQPSRTSGERQLDHSVNISPKDNEKSQSITEKPPEKKPLCEETKANELNLRSASKNSSSDLDVLHRECLSNKVSVALLPVQDMIDLASYFKRKEKLATARKKGVKCKYEKRKDERERVWVKKEAEVKSGTIFRSLKIGRRKSEHVNVEYETLAFLFKWKIRKRHYCKRSGKR